MRDTIAVVLLHVLVIALVAGGIWWQVSVWHECRMAGHSWVYCATLVGGSR